MGPTGVGKTHLAKLLAEHLFGGEDALIQLDMSEYMEKFAVSRMTGSPPGYVGYEEGGQLTEKVRRRPYCVILFDEIEKAHPDVMNILLQILEEGHLTDSLGRKIDFRNTIIIMTSNLGADLIRKPSLGFGDKDNILDYPTMQKKIDEAVKKYFKPEFINRLDAIVVFRTLSKEALRKVVHLEFSKLLKRVEKKGLNLILDQKAEDFLIEKGYQVEMGVRPLRRALEQFVEDPLAEMLLKNQCFDKSYTISVRDGQIVFFEKQKALAGKEA